MSFYHRNVARQQQQMQQWLQKRRQENATRRLAGEDPLPEEDPALFKPIPEPSPLDVYLINNQVGLIKCSQTGVLQVEAAKAVSSSCMILYPLGN